MRYEADDAGRLAPVKEDNNAIRKIDRRYVVVSKFGDYIMGKMKTAVALSNRCLGSFKVSSIK